MISFLTTCCVARKPVKEGRDFTKVVYSLMQVKKLHFFGLVFSFINYAKAPVYKLAFLKSIPKRNLLALERNLEKCQRQD